MTRQLELKPKQGKPRKGAREPLWSRALYWAPVWLPLVLMLQVTAFGLRPAWAEKERLDAAEAEVVTRENRLQGDFERLLSDQRKLSDPIYRERVRRTLRDLERDPLTLQSSRREDRAGP